MPIYAGRRIATIRLIDGVHTPTYSQDRLAHAGRTEYCGGHRGTRGLIALPCE